MIGDILSLLKITKDVISIGKEAKEMLPNGKDKDHIEKQLLLAEKELSIAEAHSAQELGYDLCKCTFPPQVMLYKKDRELTECPNCYHTNNKRITVEVF